MHGSVINDASKRASKAGTMSRLHRREHDGQNERHSREEKQINPQRQQEKVTLEKVNVDGMIGCRYGLRT